MEDALAYYIAHMNVDNLINGKPVTPDAVLQRATEIERNEHERQDRPSD